MRAATSQTWRTNLQRQNLITQVSTILLQRQNWDQILPNLNLNTHLTSSLIPQILNKTLTNPQITLNFFNFAKSKLGFHPDLKTLSKITLIMTQLSKTIKPMLNSLIQEYPLKEIVDSVVRLCKVGNFGFGLGNVVLSELVECYAEKGMYMEGLGVYRGGLGYGFVPRVRSCNVLLGVIESVGEVGLLWCLVGSMMRNRVEFDEGTWGVVGKMMCRGGRSEAVVRLLGSGVCNSKVYDLVIENYSECGRFEDAFERMNEMHSRKIEPAFIAYSSVLDGACKFGDVKVIERVMGKMWEKKLLQGLGESKYDRVIKGLCKLGRTYASDMLYKRARDEGVGLADATLGCMLAAFSKGGRVKEAMWMYGIISDTGVSLGNSYFQAFAELLCREDPSQGVNSILISLIERGVCPHEEEISKLIMSQCRRGEWQEAEALVDVIIEQGFVSNYSCCGTLVKHYCFSGMIESCMSLHQKLQKAGAVLDVTTYNQLLRGLCLNDRVEDAVEVFDYMRRNKVVSVASFLVMISGLCSAKEKRRAMLVHDEMLKLGLKPNAKTYRSLISVFS